MLVELPVSAQWLHAITAGKSLQSFTDAGCACEKHRRSLLPGEELRSF